MHSDRINRMTWPAIWLSCSTLAKAILLLISTKTNETPQYSDKHRHRWTIDVVQLTVKHLEAEQAHVWHSDGLHAMAVGEPLRLVHHLLVLVFRISVAGVRLLLLVVVVVGVGHAVLCQNWFTNYVR